MQNPIIKPDSAPLVQTLRPRGFTDIENKITISYKMTIVGLASIMLMCFMNFALTIAAIRMTKEISVGQDGLAESDMGMVHTGQTVLGYDFTDLMLMEDPSVIA